jgi:UDP-N-acetylmuramoyl-tripeptide--D-alanyl-D-alanine ligase
VENFADGEAGVARAKAEIFEGLTPGGAAILNADNRWRETLSQAAREKGARVQTFGAAPDAEARLLETKTLGDGLDVTARIDGAEVAYRLRPSAPHWAPMSLCALLMMRALGVELETGLAAVAAFEPLEGRGAARTIRTAAGAFTLVDESYNASPVSVAAALAALGARKADRRIAVLTDMLELGPDSPARHAELAKAVEAANIDLVFCAGPLMRSLWDALPQSRQGRWAPAAADLASCLARAVAPGDAVMIKGSRDSKAARLVETLVALDIGEGAGR